VLREARTECRRVRDRHADRRRGDLDGELGALVNIRLLAVAEVSEAVYSSRADGCEEVRLAALLLYNGDDLTRDEPVGLVELRLRDATGGKPPDLTELVCRELRPTQKRRALCAANKLVAVTVEARWIVAFIVMLTP
jgi:hypothetical protein